ncbi:hypothetical protein [Streptomyces sp. NPDC005438]|uniref:hypothetical protein n=1 Tax=Streptomyces sp. NPDC005438 TaxID=3156880 RepID=UPI0033BC6FED
MTATLFDLDVELVESTDPRPTDPAAAREHDENAALTPGTVNTYAVGLAMCLTCC